MKPRQSVVRSLNANPLLQSTSKQSVGKTPLKANNARRGSLWGGGGSAVPPTRTIAVTRDPRQLREKNIQLAMRQDIVGWLKAHDFDTSSNPLSNIHAKGYQMIFRQLVLIIDDGYNFSDNVPLQDEVLNTLRALEYPYVSSLDAKWFAAPASMHSWPSLLGVLHWLVELGKCYEEYLNGDSLTLLEAELVPDEFDDPMHHQALSIHYYEHAYELYMSGEVDFAIPLQAVEDRYAVKNERLQSLLDEETEELGRQNAEYEQLISSAPPLEMEQKQNELMKRDLDRFAQNLSRHDARMKSGLQSLATEKAEIEKLLADLVQLKAEKTRLSEVVKVQNLTPEEVERMNKEHDTLVRNVEDLKAKVTQTNKLVMSLEVSLTNRVAAAEEVIDQYNTLLSSPGLIPPDAEDLTIELSMASSDLQQLVRGPDMRKVVRPALSKWAEMCRMEIDAVKREKIVVDDQHDHVVHECEDLIQEIETETAKVHALTEQAEEMREAAQQEATVNNTRAAELERTMAQARMAAMAHGVGAKSRLQAVEIAYREQQEKIARVKEETIRAIIKNSTEIAEMKEAVARQLKYVQDVVEANR